MKPLCLLAVLTFPACGQDLGGDLTLHRLLIEGEGWNPVVEGLTFADGPATDADWNFYFSDLRGAGTGVYRISLDGRKTQLSGEGVSGIKVAPDGRLVCCQGAKKRIIAIGVKDGQPNTGALPIEELATEVQPNDLAVSARGFVYFTETGKSQVTLLDLNTKQT